MLVELRWCFLKNNSLIADTVNGAQSEKEEETGAHVSASVRQNGPTIYNIENPNQAAFSPSENSDGNRENGKEQTPIYPKIHSPCLPNSTRGSLAHQNSTPVSSHSQDFPLIPQVRELANKARERNKGGRQSSSQTDLEKNRSPGKVNSVSSKTQERGSHEKTPDPVHEQTLNSTRDQNHLTENGRQNFSAQQSSSRNLLFGQQIRQLPINRQKEDRTKSFTTSFKNHSNSAENNNTQHNKDTSNTPELLSEQNGLVSIMLGL